MDLCYFFQLDLELLLLFMSSLHLKTLLFKYIVIIVGNIRGDEERHDDTEER